MRRVRGSIRRLLRRKLIALVVLSMALAGAVTAVAAPELSVSQRLEDRRYGVAGERARAIGFQDGRAFRSPATAASSRRWTGGSGTSST